MDSYKHTITNCKGHLSGSAFYKGDNTRLLKGCNAAANNNSTCCCQLKKLSRIKPHPHILQNLFNIPESCCYTAWELHVGGACPQQHATNRNPFKTCAHTTTFKKPHCRASLQNVKTLQLLNTKLDLHSKQQGTCWLTSCSNSFDKAWTRLLPSMMRARVRWTLSISSSWLAEFS